MTDRNAAAYLTLFAHTHSKKETKFPLVHTVVFW